MDVIEYYKLYETFQKKDNILKIYMINNLLNNPESKIAFNEKQANKLIVLFNNSNNSSFEKECIAEIIKKLVKSILV